MATKHQVDQEIDSAEERGVASAAPAKRRLRNVTITMEEDVAKWARMEAARRDMSVSKLLGEIARERMGRSESYQRAMERALARPAFLRTDGEYLTREEANERTLLR